MSDLLLRGDRPLAPAGPALQWCWGARSEHPDPGEQERRPLSPDHPWCPPLLAQESSLPRTRLVPLEGGA